MDNYPSDLFLNKNVTSTSKTSNNSNYNLLLFIFIMILNFISGLIIIIFLKKCSNYRNKIKVINYDNYLLKNPDPPEKELLCSICLDTFNDNYVSTKCGHYYHQDCIYEWLSQKIICPNCKNNLKELENV